MALLDFLTGQNSQPSMPGLLGNVVGSPELFFAGLNMLAGKDAASGAQMGRSLSENFRKQQAVQGIKPLLEKGDFAGAARGLLSTGMFDQGVGLLGAAGNLEKLKQSQEATKAFQGLFGGMDTSAAPAAGGPTGSALPASLNASESGGNWQAQNDAVGSGGAVGHFGRAQFGQARIQDAANAGAIPQGTTPQQFMQSPELQKRAENWHFQDIDNFIRSNGYNNIVGQSINGVPVTIGGMRAVAHLGGTGGLRKFIESGGQYNPSDRNGTSLMDYFTRHRGGGELTPPIQIANPVAPQQPVQVAENEAEVQRLEQEQAARTAQADVPAPGAMPAQGFATPQAPQGGVFLPRVPTQNIMRMLALPGLNDGQRALLTKELEARERRATEERASARPTDETRNFDQFRREEIAAGRPEPTRADYLALKRAQNNVNLPPSEKEYDKQAAKDFAELNRDVAKRGMSANGKIATLNRLETLLTNPNVRTGAGAQTALTLARAAKSLFGIETEGLGPSEAVNAIANGFALELRNPSGGAGMPGALSDKDREFLMSLTPGLERTSEGNKLIIDYMRRLAKRDIEIEGLRRDYIKQNKRLDDGFYEKLADFSEKNPLFPEADRAALAQRAPVPATAPQHAPQPRPMTSGPITATHPSTGQKLMLTPNGTWEPFDG